MSNENRNFKQDILAAAGDEPILALKIISTLEYEYTNNPSTDSRDSPELKATIGKCISWAEAAPLLNYEFYAGFGGMDCHDIVFWTETKVFYIHEYDGSTSIQYVERNPQ